MNRREQRRLETRSRLLNAAEHVFSQKGYIEASILDITEAADVSKRTFYLHFTDKEALIEALAMRRFEELRAEVETTEPHSEQNDEGFRAGFERITTIIFQYAEDNPDMMRIVFGHGGSFRLQSMTREFMARAWEENMARKCNYLHGAPVPAAVLAHAIAGVIHQLLCWWFQNENDFTPTQMAAMCTSVLFDTIDVNFDIELDPHTGKLRTAPC